VEFVGVGRGSAAAAILALSNMASLRKISGENLRYHRRVKGISQEKLSFQAKVGTEYVSKVENGHINVCLDSIEKMSKALKIDPVLLLKSPPPKEE
jgi:transcriptional regulator with XRE-family HTH domain